MDEQLKACDVMTHGLCKWVAHVMRREPDFNNPLYSQTEEHKKE